MRMILSLLVSLLTGAGVVDRGRGRHIQQRLEVGDLRGKGPNTETLSANKTIAIGDPLIHFLDPGGAARDVTLPAEADSEGLMFIIVNTADDLEVITIKDDGGATICTPTQDETAIVVCDGVTWAGLVGANS